MSATDESLSGSPEDHSQDTPEPDGSLLSRIRSRCAEVAAEESLTLPIPGRRWEGALVVRYGIVDAQEVVKLNARKSDPAGVEINSDFLLRACRAVLLRDDDGSLVELTDDNGQPTTFAGLADKLGIEVESARELIAFLFEGNGLAIIAHADLVAAWMRDTSVTVDQALVGE